MAAQRLQQSQGGPSNPLALFVPGHYSISWGNPLPDLPETSPGSWKDERVEVIARSHHYGFLVATTSNDANWRLYEATVKLDK